MILAEITTTTIIIIITGTTVVVEEVVLMVGEVRTVAATEVAVGAEAKVAVEVEVTEITIEVVVLGIEIAQPSMNNGSIDWNIVRSLGAVHTVSPMSTLQLEIYSPDDYSYILMHNPGQNSSDDVVQVRIINDYHEDVMVLALALSIGSMWMTGFVINRLRRLYKYDRKFYDSTPSHLWEEE